MSTHIRLRANPPDERMSRELKDKGSTPVLVLLNNRHDKPWFVDVVRAAQELRESESLETPCTDENNVILVLDVTLSRISRALVHLHREGSFDRACPEETPNNFELKISFADFSEREDVKRASIKRLMAT